MDEETTKKAKIDPKQVEELMRMYPMLDQLMAETVLSCTEEELTAILAENKM